MHSFSTLQNLEETLEEFHCQVHGSMGGNKPWLSIDFSMTPVETASPSFLTKYGNKNRVVSDLNLKGICFTLGRLFGACPILFPKGILY